MDELEKLFGEHRDNANCKCGQDCFCWDVQKYLESKDAAQQNAHQTGGESAAKVGFLTLEEDAAIKADNTPAHPLVA